MEKVKGALKEYNEAEQQTSLEEFRLGVQREWGVRETRALEAPLPRMRRVVVVRHGMGYHNESKQMGSILSRDAELNDAGISQALEVGASLAHLFPRVGLLVSSPFRRALQTMARVVEGAGEAQPEAWMRRALVTPLCAEHTFLRSNVGQGDRGTPIRELQADRSFQALDFSLVEQYCEENGIRDGSWWHHSASRNHESKESFALRADAFRTWLGRTLVERTREDEVTLVFSHGGLLVEAFGLPRYHNCEWRTLLISEHGHAMRLAAPTVTDTPPARRALPPPPPARATKHHHSLQITQHPPQQQWRVGDLISLTVAVPEGESVEIALMKEKAMNRQEQLLLLRRASEPVQGAQIRLEFVLKPAHMGRGSFAGRRFLEVRGSSGVVLRTEPQICCI